MTADYWVNAHKKGLVFARPPDQMDPVLNGSWYYCGRPPATVQRTGSSHVGELLLNGIDRLNSAEGYVSDNVVSCCPECNDKKGAQNYAEFVAWVLRVADHLTTPSQSR